MLQVDEKTAAAVRTALEHAAARGVDVVQALDAAGVLHYPAKMRRTMRQTLEEAADLLDQLTVRQLAGADRPATSPTDLQRHVVVWLQEQARKIGDMP